MLLVHAALPPETVAPRTGIPVRVERRTLARRLWRATAADGTEFGFELQRTLVHGETVYSTEQYNYVIEQQPEPVLEIPLDESPEGAALLGWTLGNLHQPVEVRDRCIVMADDPGLRNLLGRLNLHVHQTLAVFQPYRPSGGLGGHSHAAGHVHGPGGHVHSHADGQAHAHSH